jgi:branched-chain amino acid transport system substrate-binding protein
MNWIRTLAAMLAALGLCTAAAADTAGVTATEIKIGQTMPYSGPGSPYGIIGRQYAAFFKMINEQGGINGRKINLISLDDGFSPPKTLEQTRRLVEQDNVALVFGVIGTATNTAIQRYLNSRKVPQLFISTGAAKFSDPKAYPWTMPFIMSYRHEGALFGRYILQNKPDARIGVLYQNDDLGKDYLAGLKQALGDRYPKMVVKEASYELTDPTVDSQVIALKGAGADTLVTAALARAAVQTIRKVADLGWKPLHLLSYTSQSVEAVIRPAGMENAVGIISSNMAKDPADPAWANDPGLNEWRAFFAKYMPGETPDSNLIVNYAAAKALVQVLQQCGNDLSRENIMKQAANLKELAIPVLLPGITINTSENDYTPIKQVQLQRWNGTSWSRFGPVVSD